MDTLTPEQQARYRELFETAPKTPTDEPLTIAQLRAMRRMRRERTLLLKDGFSVAEADELLAGYPIPHALGRASAPRVRWPQLFDAEPGDRYVGGLNELGETWMYDRLTIDNGEPERLLRVDPLTATKAGPLMSMNALALGRALEPVEQIEVLALVQEDLRAKYGTSFLERGRR